jgi:hypothetical protein
MFNTDYQVSYHLGRFVGWAVNGYPGGDAGLLPVFNKLLGFADIAPVWSCEGHPGDADWDTFYIMFVCNAKGFEILHKIQTGIISRLLQLEEPSTETELLNDSQRLARSVRLTVTRRASSDLKITSMPVVILDGGFLGNDNSVKETLLKAVFESTQEVLDAYKPTIVLNPQI